ncbi:MAG: ATP-dependent DNA helicase RecG [Ignavibacteriaceae bacterium]|nr:ATP-dependent DNA helicase RecG [Ignavibacteriaceae bacterium]
MQEKNNPLNQSVQYLKSIGPKRAESFQNIGIKTIRDLLFYFPTRHLDRTTILSTAKAYGYLMNGYEGELTIIGKVEDTEKRRFNRKEIFKVQFRDSTGYFECVWFHGAKYLSNLFKVGNIFAVSGKASLSKYGSLQFAHPDFDRISEDESYNMINTGKIIPFYRIPKELKNSNLGDLSLRKIIYYSVENYIEYLSETLPESILKQYQLPGIIDAVKNFHFPESNNDLISAVRRFKYEEAFYLELLVALRKKNYQTKLDGFPLNIKTKLISNFLKTLPFKLTNSQLEVLSEIKNDLMSNTPMNRLLQGDVGSGKTIVALISMLIAVDNGYQAALMVPTEILADQHAKTISQMMAKLFKLHGGKEIKVSLIMGGQKKSIREQKLSNIELQEADLIIGTHALFEEKVNFRNLGLIVIDEQHRFGVAQRGRLMAKGKAPHVLVMSATPIPRTLSMTVYGDLDNSIINEMPKNRIPIKTLLRGDSKLPDIYKFLKDKKKDGYQSFIVYPLVETSEKLELKAAEKYYESLQNEYLSELNIGLVHGRMSWHEKETVMYKFLQKEFDVLVSTTVIEVGIDIPDANIILINDAHRFGLSQLHQLRGRVGRGNKQAYCILVTKDEYASSDFKLPLESEFLSPSQIENNKSIIRLQSMVKYLNGFKIAEIDLKLRGPGDIFGVKQSGFPELKHVDIINDSEIISDSKQAAFKIIETDPHLADASNEMLRINLLTHYKNNLKYATIA